MNYQRALELAQAGKPVVLSNSGGRMRYAHFTMTGEGSTQVEVRLMGSMIARFCPDHMEFSLAGYDTMTTRDVLRSLVPTGAVWRDKKVTYYYPQGWGHERYQVGGGWLTVSYGGQVLTEMEA
jgi:hypothetical protein